MCKIDHKEASGEVASDAKGKAISGVWKLGRTQVQVTMTANQGINFYEQKGK